MIPRKPADWCLGKLLHSPIIRPDPIVASCYQGESNSGVQPLNKGVILSLELDFRIEASRKLCLDNEISLSEDDEIRLAVEGSVSIGPLNPRSIKDLIIPEQILKVEPKLLLIQITSPGLRPPALHRLERRAGHEAHFLRVPRKVARHALQA